MHFHTSAILLASLCVLVAASGCRKGPKSSAADADFGSTMFTDLTQDGIPLASGIPFDEQGREIALDAPTDPVYFGYDSYSLPSSELRKVEAVASYMAANGGTVLIIEGHCDERGSNEYNLSLGEQRALSVRAGLVSLGIGAERIQTRSFGEEQPAVQGYGEHAWSLNRRGEFRIFK
ncbi:MAG: OmpA family protein [Kiritimatiellia bacterium]|jgi:peptidoglycan-associated lipoprotein